MVKGSLLAVLSMSIVGCSTGSDTKTTWTTKSDNMAYIGNYVMDGYNVSAYLGNQSFEFEYDADSKELIKITTIDAVDKDEMLELASGDSATIDTIELTYNDENYNGSTKYRFEGNQAVSVTLKMEDGLYKNISEFNFEEFDTLSDEDKNTFTNQIKELFSNLVIQDEDGTRFIYSDSVENDIENWDIYYNFDFDFIKK